MERVRVIIVMEEMREGEIKNKTRGGLEDKTTKFFFNKRQKPRENKSKIR